MDMQMKHSLTRVVALIYDKAVTVFKSVCRRYFGYF